MLYDRNGNFIIPRGLLSDLSEAEIQLAQGKTLSNGKKVYIVKDTVFTALKIHYIANRYFTLQKAQSDSKDREGERFNWSTDFPPIQVKNSRDLRESSEDEEDYDDRAFRLILCEALKFLDTEQSIKDHSIREFRLKDRVERDEQRRKDVDVKRNYENTLHEFRREELNKELS